MIASRSFRLVATLLTLAVSGGCGSDWRPAQLTETGIPAGPLGQVLDVEVRLPALQIPGAMLAGLSLDLRFELDRGGTGKIPARVIFEDARTPLGSAEVLDLSDGKTLVFVTSKSWFTERLGPIRIGTTVFELLLDGEHSDGAWRVAGRAWESQTATTGDFDGWRRHRFLVAGTDFFSVAGGISEVAWVKERELRIRSDLEFVSSDVVLRATADAVLAINRLGFDNLQRLDPRSDFATAWQRSVGGGANPQDAILLDGKGYVSRYEPPFNDLAIFAPDTGKIIGTIPLRALAENPDATPRPAALRLAAGAVFVALQEIDRTFTEFFEGKLAVIDPNLDAVVGVIPLGGKNPFDIDVVIDSAGRETLWVALAGIFPGLQTQELSGGVVVVDPVSRAVERLVLDDDVAGGNISQIAIASERLGYAVVSDASFANRVIAFDPVQGRVLRTVLESSVQIADLDLDTHGLLAVPIRALASPTVCLFRVPDDPSLPEVRAGCALVTLPPFSSEPLD